MRAIICNGKGGPEVMAEGEIPKPPCGPLEVRIRVRMTAVNRADLVQTQGNYAPPPGASDILGLECMGEITEVGNAADGWKRGERVMALLAGGGYAEEVVVHHGSVMRAPKAFEDVEAGAFCETFLTAYSNIFQLGEARPGSRVLIHGGSSGIGTSALSLCKEAGITAFVTAGSDAKCKRCIELGAADAINYRTADWGERIGALTNGEGVDLIVDCIGGKYLQPNLKALRTEGRLIIIGLMGGREAMLPLDMLLVRRLRVLGSTLRGRSVDAKARLVKDFRAQFGEALEQGRLRPIIDSVLPIAQVGDAHRRMQESQHIGKIALRGF